MPKLKKTDICLLSSFWFENVSCKSRRDECAVRIIRNKYSIELVLSKVLFFFPRNFGRLYPFSPIKKASRGNSPGFYDSLSSGVVERNLVSLTRKQKRL